MLDWDMTRCATVVGHSRTQLGDIRHSKSERAYDARGKGLMHARVSQKA